MVASSRLMVLLMLAALLSGCTVGEEKRPARPAEEPQPVQSHAEDTELDTLMQESQEIDSFLAQVEAGDSIDVEL